MSPMTPLTRSAEVTATIGKLCVGGDRACAHGDFAGLRNVALQLADFAPEPIHCELARLVEACGAEPCRATELWDRLKTQLFQDPRS